MPRKIQWSANRPQRPDVDPMLADLRSLLQNDKRSWLKLADLSGLAPSTLQKIADGTTRRPMGLTIQMAYATMGFEIRAVKVGKKK